MKVTLIGAAGVRTPLLIHGLAEAAGQLPLEEIALYDIDQERLRPIGRVAAAMARERGLTARLVTARTAAEAVDGAEVVISSIRVGGIEARVQDEQIALAHHLVGQETVGAGGFACALRNLTAMLGYARLIEQRAPRATLINFTNPVGIVSQGLLNHTGVRVLGVCDTPLETFETIAHALERDPFTLRFEYFGLNHLGWVRAIRTVEGTDLMPALLRSPERLRRCYRHALFPPEFLMELGLLPTEYLYFYYFPERARANTERSGQSRGQLIAALNLGLFQTLALAPERELIAAYENYLRERNASYFSIEASGGEARDDRPLYSQFSGYERIAILLLAGLYSDQVRMVPLTVRNLVDGGRAIGELAAEDAVELPCDVSRAAVRPHAPGPIPAQALELLLQVKEYERATAAAAAGHDRHQARLALERNPLVGVAAAAGVLADYERAFGTQLGLQAAAPSESSTRPL
ncbi:MAG: family 4 glycosyl hydrolase [Terriglobales bacterium]